MATFKAYANGATMGRGNNAPKGGKRGQVNGWSRGAVRRHLQFLYSVDVPRLDGIGYGVTLTIRNTPPTHTEWMTSDTTGVPPRIAKKYGFVQEFYGAYLGAEPFGTVNNNDMMAFINAFKGAPPISFRYGYPDNKSHGHIVVTRKP